MKKLQATDAATASKSSFQKMLNQADVKSGTNDLAQSFLGDVGRAQGNSRKQRLKNVAQKMEGMFLNLMIEQMRKSLPDISLGKKSQGKKMFRARLDRKYAKKMAKSKKFGIAEAVYKQFAEGSMDEVGTNKSGSSGHNGKGSLKNGSADKHGLKMGSSNQNGNLSMRNSTPRAAFGGL